MKSQMTGVGALVSLSAMAFGSLPAGAPFTYQGRLKDRGVPANGAYDLRFTLWDDPEAIGPIGSLACHDNVMVVEGLFTVQLDFGEGLFDGNPRWIEVAVRPGGAPGNCSSGAFTTLAPRQPLTAAPFALYALDAPGAGLWQADDETIYNANPGNVGIGTASPAARLEVRGDVKLGASGELYAAGGEENVRIVRGRVQLNGDVATGTGFTVAFNPGTGAYRIDFDPPFASEATVTANAYNATSTIALIVTPDSTGAFAVIRCMNTSDHWVGCPFVFTAVGPR